MFKKLMAKFGVGAATVDLRLDQPAYRLGETVTGHIHIEGGNVEQRITELSVLLMMNARVKGQIVTRQVHSVQVAHSFKVLPKPYTVDIPVSFELPQGLAISSPSIQYGLQTKLDVEMALDPTDMDRVEVLPPEPVERVLNALNRLDLRQKPDSGGLTPYGQEFSFFTGQSLGIPLRELDVVFFSTPGEMRLLLELDLTMPGMLMGRQKEYKAELIVPQELLAAEKEEELSRFLLEKLREYAENPQAIPYVSMASYGQMHGGRSGMGGMIGGMAAGLLGGMLLGELMSDAGELAFGESGEESGGDEGGDDFDFGGFDDL
ncbi:sporulation protein [Brevibacillus borstelensis]|uniref:sporulation protein n=1 Tax=Brevibacillus borstelensis TaxID=45462 RepID=UPI00149031A7|nr:sporulation protein [Brevibacillus borstelensis]NOU53917.1 sporulation protein [Brevibacillus borstelensis]